MDKVAKIKEWLKPHLKENKVRDEHEEGFFHCAMLLNDFIDTLSEEPDKSLEEAAEEYRRNSIKTIIVPNIDGPLNEYCGNVKGSFIAGANWQKEQMLKDAEETELYWDGDFLAIDLNMRELGYSEKDKVRIIILKEEEENYDTN